jgi:hypothetical protein
MLSGILTPSTTASERGVQIHAEIDLIPLAPPHIPYHTSFARVIFTIIFHHHNGGRTGKEGRGEGRRLSVETKLKRLTRKDVVHS